MIFSDWLNMSVLVDALFVVFAIVCTWKLNSCIIKSQELEHELVTLKAKNEQLESDLQLTMRNPQAAKRLLKNR